MSQENVEIVRRTVDAWNRRDLEVLPAVVHPEAEYVNSPTAVEPGTRRGYDEITAVLQTQWDILLDARQEIERIYDQGDEIFVLGRSRRMPESAARLEAPFLASFTIHQGRVTRISALAFGATEVEETLGLSEQDAHADT
jgi:ketosteroid isomerase-like protein